MSSINTGNYALALERIIPPSLDAQPIQYSQTITDELNPGGDIDLFSFEGTENDAIMVMATWQSGGIRPCIELYAPDGGRTDACSNAFSNRIDTTLTMTGTSLILVKDLSGINTGNYSLTIQCVSGICASLPTHILTINKLGTGSGKVTSSPAGIDCGSDCSETYNHGTSVTLTASADPGSIFAGWSGNGCSGTGQCIVEMDNKEDISATFTLSTSGPDLTGQWWSFNESCKNTKKGIKCKVKGKLDIQNIGDMDAKTSFVRFYLSDNNVYDVGDMYLKQVATGKIKAGMSKRKTFSYSFPAGMSISGKYIIAVIDATNIVIESDETNNNIAYGPMP